MGNHTFFRYIDAIMLTNKPVILTNKKKKNLPVYEKFVIFTKSS